MCEFIAPIFFQISWKLLYFSRNEKLLVSMRSIQISGRSGNCYYAEHQFSSRIRGSFSPLMKWQDLGRPMNPTDSCFSLDIIICRDHSCGWTVDWHERAQQLLQWRLLQEEPQVLCRGWFWPLQSAIQSQQSGQRVFTQLQDIGCLYHAIWRTFLLWYPQFLW